MKFNNCVKFIPVKPATMDALRDKNITVLYSIEDQYTYTSNGLFVAVCKK